MFRYPIYLLLALLSRLCCYSQDIRSCILHHMIDTDTAGPGQLPDFNTQPEARFFLLSELHNISINPVLQLGYIRKLHRDKALRYVILEMPHSYAFRYNLFLKTGADSLLPNPDIRHSAWLLQQLRRYNNMQPDRMQLRFIGIDLCIGNDASGFKEKAYRFCLAYFEELLRLQAPGDPLLPLLHKAGISRGKQEIRNHNRAIAEALQSMPQHYRNIFNHDYNELLAITCAATDYRGSRDDEMLGNFVRMLGVYQLDPAQTTFFASFGETHVNTADGKGMLATQLQHYYTSRHMPHGLSITGVQYFNTTTGKGNSVTIGNDGIVRAYGAYRKRNASLLADLEACQAQLKHNLGIVTLEDTCSGPYLRHFNYLILCRQYTALNP